MCTCVLCIIYEGKGRLKPWTLCDGLSEGVMGYYLRGRSKCSLRAVDTFENA